MKTSTIKTEKYFVFISAAILIAVWKITSVLIGAEVILPSPENTIISLLNLIITKKFFLIILFSLGRGMVGFIISLMLGIFFGFLAGLNKFFNKLLEPFFVIIRSTPLMSVILIALIWFRAENVPIFASFLVSFPIICSNVIEGIKSIDINIIQMTKIYNIKKWRVVKEIYFPSILPFLTAAISASAGIGWKAVIAAEVLSQPEYAMGTSMQNSKIYLDTEKLFAWTLIAIIISFVFESIIRKFEKSIIKWE